MPTTRAIERRRLGNAGLTLIEVLTAISLIGIVTAIAATNFTAMVPSFRVRAAALRVAGDINQARMAAIKEGRYYEYFPISGGYRIRRDNRAGGVETVKQVVVNTEFPHVVFGKTGVTTDPYNVDVSAAAAAPGAAITFDSNGTVRNAAGVFLQIPEAHGLAQQVVTLSAAGRVRVWRRAADGAWN
jgi:prepilin-type N-terminal cleavage/methylation domain-containing protein